MKNNESNEKAKQIWSKTDSKIYKKFVIPVDGMSKEEAKKQRKKYLTNKKENIIKNIFNKIFK
jgi:hypothetical protein